jgi:hypothetical protein
LIDPFFSAHPLFFFPEKNLFRPTTGSPDLVWFLTRPVSLLATRH